MIILKIDQRIFLIPLGIFDDLEGIQPTLVDPVTSSKDSDNLESENFQCERKGSPSKCFQSVASLLRHIGHVELCKNHYGPERIDKMKKKLKNDRDKKMRSEQNEMERKLRLERDRESKRMKYKHSPKKESERKKLEYQQSPEKERCREQSEYQRSPEKREKVWNWNISQTL